MNRNKKFLQKVVIASILICLILILGILSDKFFTVTNFSNVFRQITMLVITGSAVTLLMISGNLDLSVGSVLALSAVLSAKFAVMGLSVPVSILFSSLFGIMIGVLNGFMVVKVKIPSIIATLGTMYIARGLSFVICQGQGVNVGLPKNFDALGRSFIGPIPLPLILMAIVVTGFYIIESRTVLGKYSFAIGGNKTTAYLSGINVGAVVMLLYILVGVFASFSGSILASRLGVGQPNIGVGFEFDVIVAAILGGASLNGGEGSVIGMVMGALIIGFLGNGLNLLGVHSFYQTILQGVVLIGAVVLDLALKHKVQPPLIHS